MRLYSFVAAAVLLSASLAAHADTITEMFTGNGASQNINGYADVSTSSFLKFDPSLGSLDSITVAVSGTATSSRNSVFLDVSTSDGLRTITYGTGSGNSFAFSSYGTDTYNPTVSLFSGAGLTYLQLTFDSNGVVTTGTTGTITYNYTPTAGPAAVTPEPSSLVLLGTGLLGLAGVARKRYA